MKRALGLAPAVLVFFACAHGGDPPAPTSTSESTATPGPDASVDASIVAQAPEASAPVDADGDGFPADKDCDDHDAKVHPGATEICNGKDDDCNGKVDDIPATLDGSLSNAHWALAGAATITNGWAQLTTEALNEAGALWWNAPYLLDAFDASATFWIQSKDGGADGLAFAWVPGSDVAHAGGAGGVMGVPLGGWAVVIDTYQNPGEPPAPFLALFDATGGSVARQSLPHVSDGQNHRLRVRLVGAQVSAWVDGVLYFPDVALPGYVPPTGHWGFTAATGGLGEAHAVRDVTMTFPDGQGCVP